jgi:uroporphyrinogen decarboxylase
MKPREIVQRTLRHDFPARIARSFEPTDFCSAGTTLSYPNGEWAALEGGAWERKDEWGNTWRRIDPTSKGEVAHGAVEDLSQVETVPLPDFDQAVCYQEAVELFSRHPDHYHLGFIHGYTFSIARKLRRMDIYLMDLVSDSQRLSLLHDRVDEKIIHQMKRLRESGADGIMFAEDWGTQLDLLISPQLWRREFMPRFQALNDYAHLLGLDVFMHSCGKMTVIIPDLIETGVDVFQFDQPQVHGIDTLAAFQDAAPRPVTFWCPVDIQFTLQSRDETTIRREARELIEKLWRRRGGFIAGFYQDEPSIGLPPEFQAFACEEFLNYGALIP